MVLLCHRPSADLASAKPRAARKTKTHDWRQKIAVRIAWNPLGFHLLKIPPKGMIFTAEYYCDNLLAA
jgi:hypothetical protein